jgi:hypothetical protein
VQKLGIEEVEPGGAQRRLQNQLVSRVGDEHDALRRFFTTASDYSYKSPPSRTILSEQLDTFRKIDQKAVCLRESCESEFVFIMVRPFFWLSAELSFGTPVRTTLGDRRIVFWQILRRQRRALKGGCSVLASGAQNNWRKSFRNYVFFE